MSWIKNATAWQGTKESCNQYSLPHIVTRISFWLFVLYTHYQLILQIWLLFLLLQEQRKYICTYCLFSIDLIFQFIFFICVVSTFRCIWKLVIISSHLLTLLFIGQDCFSFWTWALKVWLHLGSPLSTLQLLEIQEGHQNHPALTWILRIWTVGFMFAKEALYLLSCLSKHSIVL